MPFPLTHRSWPCDSYAHCPNSTHKMYYIFPSQEDSLVPHSSFFYTSYATVCYSLWIYGLQHIYQIITGCYQHISKYHIYLSGTGLLHSIWFFLVPLFACKFYDVIFDILAKTHCINLPQLVSLVFCWGSLIFFPISGYCK